MFALKYEGLQEATNQFEELLLQHKKNTGLESNDPSVIEEDLIRSMSDFMAGKLDHPTISSESFLKAFNLSLNNLKIDEIDVDENLFSILNMNMSNIFEKKNNRITDPGLILFEASFRDWLTKEMENNKNFKIDCT